LNGQWIGTFEGTNSGSVVMDIDDRETHFEGHIFAKDRNPTLPITYAHLRTEDRSSQFQIKLNVVYFGQDYTPLADDVLAQLPTMGVQVARELDTRWVCETDRIEVEWRSDIGTAGKAVLPRSRANDASEYVALPEVGTWEDFRHFARERKHYQFIFRGQENSRWRLRSHFHRTKRADLWRFINNDLPTLQHQLIGHLKHRFDRSRPEENGAFFSLIQHHGYPTPLLDWTYSPYIGAYFAFRHVRDDSPVDGKVRIFVFDKKSWTEDYGQPMKLAPNDLHFSVLEAWPIENLRMLPQQALSTVTNIDDVETYLRIREAEKGKSYLQVIDLPISERSAVMDELAYMGIGPAALFPGIDGICEQVKLRYF
jgi:hypothetical protein